LFSCSRKKCGTALPLILFQEKKMVVASFADDVHIGITEQLHTRHRYQKSHISLGQSNYISRHSIMVSAQ
jgi:hypothetical protein